MSSVDNVQLLAAFQAAVSENSLGLEAGPKALLEVVKANDAKFADVNIMKAKKMVQQIRQQNQQEESAVASVGDKKRQIVKTAKRHRTCPGKHGLTRFLSPHEGCCCDSCHEVPGRKKCVEIGAAMWGCRVCNWDICEEKCYEATPQETQTTNAQMLEDKIAGLECKIQRCVEVSPDQEKLEKILNLVSKEVADNETKILKVHIMEWQANGGFTEEEAAEKKEWFLKELNQLHGKIAEAIAYGPNPLPKGQEPAAAA